MSALGTRIRELRISRNLTLEQVGTETGLSVSFLSMLERNKVSISVDNLEKLAHYFEVHMVHFFNTPDQSPVFITRQEQIQKTNNGKNSDQVSVTLLANSPTARIEPLLIRIAPGKEEPHFREHEADTLLYILEGEARLISENLDEVDLHQGDMAYYVNYPHRRISNKSTTTPLLIISVTAPPTSSLDDMIQARQGGWVMPEKSK
ncbi:MAG: helix-turn-helix domain-containing protein [Chloroflexi bacterium]|nr:helix-turn-helix domain-containing protein [Chloroflexota bacterium]